MNITCSVGTLDYRYFGILHLLWKLELKKNMVTAIKKFLFSRYLTFPILFNQKAMFSPVTVLKL